MRRNELQEHVFSTYLSLRFGMVIIAVAYPILVYVAGAFDGVALQDSISAYYWASATGEFKARIWFVGGLFAIAAFLYLYKGFTATENIALNIAAVLGVGVAAFPMEWECKTNCGGFSLHGFCAVSMFVCLVYVVWFCARDTLRFLPSNEDHAWYRRLYAVIGLVMLVSPLTAFVVNSLVGARSTYVFFIEAAGIWAFALYWWFKSSELEKSGATRTALRGDLET